MRHHEEAVYYAHSDSDGKPPGDPASRGNPPAKHLLVEVKGIPSTTLQVHSFSCRAPRGQECAGAEDRPLVPSDGTQPASMRQSPRRDSVEERGKSLKDEACLTPSRLAATFAPLAGRMDGRGCSTAFPRPHRFVNVHASTEACP